MQPRLVRESATLSTSRTGPARFGTKTIEIPSFFAGLGGPEDTRVLLNGPIQSENLGGIVLPLYAAGAVLAEGDRHDADYVQSALGQRWKEFKERAVVLIDPVPELFYVTRPGLRFRVGQLEGFPNEFMSRFEKVTASTHFDAWDSLEPQYYLGLVDWISRYQSLLGSDVTLPLTPFIAEATKSYVDIAVKMNIMAASYLTAGNHLPGLYFSINYPLFRRQDLVLRLATRIDELVQMWSPHLLAVRLRGLPRVESDDDDPLMTNLASFLLSIGAIGRKVGLPVVLLNSGTYGFASVSSGVDVFSELLNGNIGDPIDTSDGSEEGANKRKRGFATGYQAGRVYHPVHKINLSRADYGLCLDADGAYPEIPESRPPLPAAPDIDFRRQAKHYRAAARADEVRKVKDAIRAKEERALAEEFARSRARNAEKLIPNHY